MKFPNGRHGQLLLWLRQQLRGRSRPPNQIQPECLTETAACLFVDHRLPEPQAGEVETHIDDCSGCRELIAALARDPHSR